jgi:hypothetical protein
MVLGMKPWPSGSASASREIISELVRITGYKMVSALFKGHLLHGETPNI